MFNDGITPEAIPERIYEICKILVSKDFKTSELHEILEPSSLNNDRSYFGKSKIAAIDLGLIEENEDKILTYVADKKIVRSLDTFRTYCNSVIWKDRKSLFYKVSAAFLASNEKLLHNNNITSQSTIAYIQNLSHDQRADVKIIRGIRFWLEFLGLGYIQEKLDIYFLPNMYVALKDFIRVSNFAKNKEYSVREFIEIIEDISKVAFEDIGNTLELNMAFSNALRTMHDFGEIQLIRNLDSKEIWKLYSSDVHAFGDKVTHIKYKGIK